VFEKDGKPVARRILKCRRYTLYLVCFFFLPPFFCSFSSYSRAPYRGLGSRSHAKKDPSQPHSHAAMPPLRGQGGAYVCAVPPPTALPPYLLPVNHPYSLLPTRYINEITDFLFTFGCRASIRSSITDLLTSLIEVLKSSYEPLTALV
jgi:hypothetical protein